MYKVSFRMAVVKASNLITYANPPHRAIEIIHSGGTLSHGGLEVLCLPEVERGREVDDKSHEEPSAPINFPLNGHALLI